ncbi:hypothetical protein AB0H86_29625 [Streptomyces sp. NPDC050997]|uniref:hypothetical protein n=1 Tax=Streptomyces sp. NPDC050997 TaxID=3155519 RepID=UPI00342E42DB
MRRSARALSAAVLAGAVIGLAVPVASAEPTAEPVASAEPTAEPVAEPPVAEPVEEQPFAVEEPVAESVEESVDEPADDPVDASVDGSVEEPVAELAAEVSPSSVSPGGNVTVSVSCDPTGGSPPGSITATSQAVDSGSVQLGLVSGDDGTDGNADAVAAGPAYRGTARIAPDANFEGGQDSAAQDSPWTVDGTCPTAPGGHGRQWSAKFTVNRGSGTACTESYGSSCASHRPCAEPQAAEPQTAEAQTQADPCHAAGIQHGVRAGEGGTFTDSVPALVAGGLLITGALGAAVHRLRRREHTSDR